MKRKARIVRRNTSRWTIQVWSEIK